MRKSKIQKALDQAKQSLKTVQEYFGTDWIYSFEDNTEKYWYSNHRNLSFDNNPWDYSKGESAMYSYRICRSPIVKGEFTLMKVDNDCGEQFYIILDNAKQIKDE